MTARVPKHFPQLPNARRLNIAKPTLARQFAAEEQGINHLLGCQFSLVHKMVFGPGEPDDGVRRFLWNAHPNARNLVMCVVPFGYPSGPTYGEIVDFQIGGASQDGVPVRVTDAQADLSTLQDIPFGSVSDCILVGEGTPGDLQEVAWQTSNLRPHSVLAFEAIRTQLAGSDDHVHRTISDPLDFISDDAQARNAGSSPCSRRSSSRA